MHPTTPLRGRGALSNPDGRFESRRSGAFDDGWDSRADFPERIATTVRPEIVRRLISRNDSPDIPFDQGINPYRGCEHGCIYCYARPSHSYVGLSPGLDFETQIFAKKNGPEALERELRNPRYVPRVISIGANTDPYQPLERDLEITRDILKVLLRHRHPTAIITKSASVLRDLDLLQELAAMNLAQVHISVTSLKNSIARSMEPRASAPRRRLEAIRQLKAAGVPVGMMVAPIVPGLTDEELEHNLEAGAAAGATRAGYVLLRLPHELKSLFAEWLDQHFPERADRVLHLLRSMRGGEDNDPRFGSRMRGTGSQAQLIARRFEIAARINGLNTSRQELDCGRFVHRPEQGRQLRLMGL
ncbi:MAG: PA0069 family radical SAM protein [bacterium]|nr:PA0069 family radical SAM protein [bacterium]